MSEKNRHQELSLYLMVSADASTNTNSHHAERLREAAAALKEAAANMCGQGVYGCRGGKDCTSYHR